MSHTAPTGNQPLPEPERLWLRNKAPLLQRHWHEVRTQMTGWGDPLLFGSRNGGRVCREKLGIGSPAAPLSLSGKWQDPTWRGGTTEALAGPPRAAPRTSWSLIHKAPYNPRRHERNGSVDEGRARSGGHKHDRMADGKGSRVHE